MPGFPAFLNRFRRSLVPPGRPSEALGVPASGKDLEGELGPLLSELTEVDEQASQILTRARESATRRREDGAREAAAILQQAREQADAERARAAAEQRQEANANAESARATAAREAERVRAVREERVGQFVSEVLECVRRSSS